MLLDFSMVVSLRSGAIEMIEEFGTICWNIVYRVYSFESYL